MHLLGYVWAAIVAFVRVTAFLIQLAIGIILFLAAVAEVASFGLDHGNVVFKSLINLLGRFTLQDIVFQPPEGCPAPKQCSHYEQRATDLRCQEKPPRERFLCTVTVPPVEYVCMDKIASAPLARPFSVPIESERGSSSLFGRVFATQTGDQFAGRCPRSTFLRCSYRRGTRLRTSPPNTAPPV